MITRAMVERGLKSRGVDITPEHKRLMNILWGGVPMDLPPMDLVPADNPGVYSDQSKVNSGGVLASLDLPF